MGIVDDRIFHGIFTGEVSHDGTHREKRMLRLEANVTLDGYGWG